MKSRFIIIITSALMAVTSALNAQETPKSPSGVNDSPVLTKENKEIANLSNDISEKKIKLEKMEGTLQKKMEEKNNSEAEAQSSSEKNAKAASKLTDDATDKKLSRKARKTSKEAKGDAKSARKDNREFESLEKDIKSLRKKIADDEKKLLKLQSSANANN